MRFNPTAFDRHLANMGQAVLWRSSAHCACVSPYSGAPAPGCRVCLGKGSVWAAPVQTVCGVASQKTQRQWAAFGQWEDGDLVLSVPRNSPVWEAGRNDRIGLLNAEDRFSMPLKRGDVGERLLFAPTRIDRVFWIGVSGGVVEGEKPVFGDDGVPVWGSPAPPLGMSYSITGWKYPEYFIYTALPGSRNMHGGMRLPKNVVLRRWDLLGR